jgi:hypothetical protein
MFANAPAFAGVTQGATEVAIVENLTLVRTEQLDFGGIIAGTTAGTVVVSPLGVRTATGGAVLAGGAPQAAAFAGRGRRNQLMTITFGAPSITITRGGGTQTMTVDSFTINNPPSATLAVAGPRYRISATNGFFEFPVGATLRVGANQTPGLYTGTFSMTANYQ